MEKKIIRRYVTLTLLLSLSASFFFATYTAFLYDRGMNVFLMNVINCFYMIGIFVLEIPTGALADSVGRKWSMTLSCFILALSTFIYYVSGSFWLFVLAELVGALGYALNSGAMDAWAVDSLNYHGYEGKLEHVFKRASQTKQVGIIVGSVVGGYLGQFDLAWPWLAATICTIFCGFYCLVVVNEKYFQKQDNALSFGQIKKIAQDSISYGLKNKALMYIIIFETILFATFQTFNMHWPVLFMDFFKIKVSYLGWIFAVLSTSIIIGNQFSVWFAQKIKNEKMALIWSQCITAIGMLVASIVSLGLGPVMIGFFVHEAGRGMFTPLKQAYLNRRIPSEKRATVLSFDSMITKLGQFVGLITSGLLALYFGIPFAWLISGITVALCVLVFSKISNEEQAS